MTGIAYDVMLDTEILILPLPIRNDKWNHQESFSNPRLLENIKREGI